MPNRFLIAMLAGVFAAPSSALAQSSVTISGYMKMAVENVKLGQSAKSPDSEVRVADEASRLIFNVCAGHGAELSGCKSPSQV